MAESNPQYPQRIGSYEILALLGDGGSGPVFHGLHIQLARPAAIKVLRDDLAKDPNVVRRFQREARIAAQLHHPNIVEIYDTGERDGHYYIARSMIDGQTLRRILDERRPSVSETVRIARQIADALDHAHERGVIHRDLHPGVVVIDRRGLVTIVDFGIAGAFEDVLPIADDATALASRFEFPAYVAPEQATGQPAIPRTDVYALGCIIYEMLTGEPPFAGIAPDDVLATLLREVPIQPSERNPDLPPEIDDVMMQALAKSPADRHSSATALVGDLTRVLGTGELQRTWYAIPPIVTPPAAPRQPAAAAPPSPPAAAPAAATTPAAPVMTPEPIVIERIVYRSRRHEPAVWYGVGTTLLAIALLLNLFWDDDGDSARADVVPTATITATSQSAGVEPTATEPAAATVAPTADATVEPTEVTTLEPTPAETPEPTVEPTPPPPSLAAGGDLILISTARDDVPAGLLVVDAADGGASPVFETDPGVEDASQFVLSPDGGSLALAATPEGADNTEIYVLDIASGELLQLTDADGDDMMPRWSADGSQIAFISNRDGNSEIYVMNADGSGETNLTDDPAADYSHAWSPDGAQIAFVSNRTGDNEIFRMEADGSGLINLTDDPDADWAPAWSPDGSRIAFASNRDGNDDVFLMDADGDNASNLTDDPASDNYPVWSPDGAWIAFVSDRDDSSDIFIIAPAGNGVQPMGATIYQEDSPAWSPDSMALAFTRTIEDDSDIFVATLDGATPRRLTMDPAADGAPQWVSVPEGDT